MITNEYVRSTANKPVRGEISDFCKLYRGEFYVELKLDGSRVFVERKGDRVLVCDRHSSTYTEETHPRLIELLRGEIRFDSVLLDGELVAFGGNRVYDVRRKDADLRVVFFDILRLGKADLTGEPLSVRREELKNTVLNIVPYRLVSKEREVYEFFDWACRAGYEGIIVKPASSPYHGEWLKVKAEETLDAVILGVKKTSSLKRGYAQTLLIGFYRNGDFESWGHVNAGSLSPAERRALAEVAIERKVGEDAENLLIPPEVVVEVRYLEALPSRRLREGRVIRLRWDKPPEECNPPLWW